MNATNAADDAQGEESPFERPTFGPDRTPEFIGRLKQQLLSEDEPEHFVFEGVEVDLVHDARVVSLAVYDPAQDAEATSAASDGPATGSLATQAWRWTQAVREHTRSAWGEPDVRPLEYAGDEPVIETLLDSFMSSLGISDAEYWLDGKRHVALLTGWTGEPTQSQLVQMFVLSGYDPQSAADDAARETQAPSPYEEVCRIWADSGIEDPTGQYLVFFDGQSLSEDQEERATLLALVSSLGLQRVDPPTDAEDGEVWVRYNDYLREEIENWA